MANIPTSIYITHLEREGSFIKVWGQTDRSLPIAIEKALQQMKPQFEQGMYSPAIENFQVGIMCCAKFKDELYYRARITNISYLTQGMVEVLFVDYGNRDVISCMNTRTMSGLQTGLISIPAQAKDFILAHVTLPNWDLTNFEIISSELRYLEFHLVPILEIGPYTLISLYLNKQDVSESLVERGLLLKIPIQFQQMTLQPVIARNAPPGIPVATHQLPIAMSALQPKIVPATQQISTPTLLTYKALPLDNESEHQIYVSYVSDGPCLFSVQLKKMEEQLKRLMTEINCMELQPLEEYPLPGTVCLAQSSEDGYICRAVVTSMVDGQYKGTFPYEEEALSICNCFLGVKAEVFYVDFGNTELLQFDKLFQIPFKYVIPKVMATRFALAGLENATVSIEMKCKFKEFVNNRPLFMRVKPAATKSALPLCELWDDTNIKALDMIKEAALLSYPEPASLSRGLNQEVKVCFVYSCNKIYVQSKTKENELKQLMAGLQETCDSRPLFNVNDLKPGAPCCSIFPDDSVWYRGEILQIDGDCLKIRYIDFGNEAVVPYGDIRVPLPEHVTALRPQAIECCLNGYQNIEPDEKRDLLLEELIFDQDLSMRVVEIQGSRTLVDLYDKQHYNVASLLLEKIASVTSMVSPLLIQDNHRIEHRKRSSPQGNYREFRDKKPLRELNDRNRQENNWRQNKFSRPDEKSKAFTPNKHNFFQRRNNRNDDDNWNEQSPVEKPDKFSRTNNRDNESDWTNTDSSENRSSFQHGNKRFDEQRGRNFTPRDNFNNWDAGDNENKNVYQRNKRGDFKEKTGGFDKREGFQRRDGFERRDKFEKRDGFERRDGGFEKRDGGFEKRDGGFEKRDGGFERRDGFEKRGGFEKRDYSEKRNGFEKRDNFEQKDGFKKFNRNQSGYERNFDGKSNKNFNDNRSNDEGFTKPRSRDYKKDGSEKSWSDTSEKSWKKGPKFFDKPRNNKFDGPRKGFSPPDKSNEVVMESEDWGTDAAVATNDASTNLNSIAYDYASETDRFLTIDDILGTTEVVSIAWFYNPVHFYCQLNKNKMEFREMMEELQINYRNRQPGSAASGAPVIVPFSEDGALYRAEVITCQLNQYHVKYIDYGNTATVNKVYPIEKKYMTLPAQAIPCGLQGIAPCGENWPDANIYSSYFDKDSFNCQFVTVLEDKYYIQLYHNEDNVGNLLAEASLGIYLEAPAEIDTTLLVNQQIIVILRDVASLSDITLEIEPGVAVKASMHNLTSATETYEDTLKQWIGHYLIMYVDTALEDKLEVTLYDLTGQKLQILNQDEGAYDTVEPICPLPIYSNTVEGLVSYASAESIYIQPNKFANTIEDLLEALYEQYNAAAQEEPVTPVEGQIYAALSSDSNWYRASVSELKGDNVIVTYIDYGNTESIPMTDLRELRPQFYQPHMLAVEILIPGDKEQYSEKDVTISVAYGELGWEGQVVTVNNEDAELVVPEVQQSEVEMEQAPITDVTPTEQEFISEEEPLSNLEVGVSVVISHIDSPNEFYIQLSDAAESIGVLQQELQDQISSLSDLETPTAGVLCAAPYSVCQQWFRAQVLDADDDITTVRFVDFGNTDVITNSDVHVKTLPTEMLSIEYHAKLCSLFVKPVGEEWSASALDNFETYTSVENLRAEIVHQDEKTTYIELYANGENVGEMLKYDGSGVDLQIETESSSTGFISHLNSPSEFWIQLESSCTDLEWVADQLANANNYPALEDLTPGSLCAAIFSDDDSWYRARILSNTVAGLEVIFIDYGNSCSCSGLRELPEDLIMLPPLALKCSLQKPTGILQWSQAATEKFKELSADGATVFNVNVLTPGETCIVQLTYNDEDVSSQLAPETKQCFVSHVDSLESFWVQFMDDNAQIEDVAAQMENAESWPEISDVQENSLVAALYEDGIWYRAKILKKSDEGYEVLFIDSGSTSHVTNLRELPEEYAKIPPLASKFKLDVAPKTKWGENSEAIFRKLTDCGVALFDAEVASEDVLRLYLNGIDVRSSLECAKCTPSVSLQSSPRKIPIEPAQLISEEDCVPSDPITLGVVNESDKAENMDSQVNENNDFPIEENNDLQVDENNDFSIDENNDLQVDENNDLEIEETNSEPLELPTSSDKISDQDPSIIEDTDDKINEAPIFSKPDKTEGDLNVENEHTDAGKIVEGHLNQAIENAVFTSETNRSDDKFQIARSPDNSPTKIQDISVPSQPTEQNDSETKVEPQGEEPVERATEETSKALEFSASPQKIMQTTTDTKIEVHDIEPAQPPIASTEVFKTAEVNKRQQETEHTNTEVNLEPMQPVIPTEETSNTSKISAIQQETEHTPSNTETKLEPMQPAIPTEETANTSKVNTTQQEPEQIISNIKANLEPQDVEPVQPAIATTDASKTSETERAISNTETKLKPQDVEPVQRTIATEETFNSSESNTSQSSVAGVCSEEINEKPTIKSIDTLEVKEINNQLSKGSEEFANTEGCDKIVEVIGTDEQNEIREDKATTEASDIGHSPKKT